VATKGGRAVQGMSGGGLGALRYAFKFPNMFSSVWAFAPACDDNASNVAANEPRMLSKYFNGSVDAFCANEPQNEAQANPSGINGLPIHVTVGGSDPLLSTEQDLDSLLTSLGITHDPLEIVPNIGHDFGGLQAMTKGSSYQFASDHFTA